MSIQFFDSDGVASELKRQIKVRNITPKSHKDHTTLQLNQFQTERFWWKSSKGMCQSGKKKNKINKLSYSCINNICREKLEESNIEKEVYKFWLFRKAKILTFIEDSNKNKTIFSQEINFYFRKTRYHKGVLKKKIYLLSIWQFQN